MRRVVLTLLLGAICTVVLSQNVIATEQKMVDCGLVDVQALDGAIAVKLIYSTINNFCNADMYGDFEKASHVGNDQNLLERGLISAQSVANRKILADLLKSVGFTQHPKEWWHFHKCTMDEMKAKFTGLDF